MRELPRRAALGRAHLREFGLEAVREMRSARHRRIVLDPPGHLDGRELALRGGIAVMHGVIGQREAAARIERTSGTAAVEALGARLPFLHADPREPVAMLLVAEGIGTRVFVDFELVGQRALVAHGRRQRALGIGGRGGILVVEAARGQGRALQGPRARPLGQRIGFGAGREAREVDGLRRQLGQRGDRIGHHQRVRLAVGTLLPIAVKAFVLEQAMHEVPVGLALPRVGAVSERLREREAKAALRLGMGIEDIGDDRVGALVDPDLLVAPEMQHVEPGAHGQLIRGEAAVGAQPARGEHVPLDRPVTRVGLLDPQRDRLRDQALQGDIVVRRHHVQRKAVIAPERRTPDRALHDQFVSPKRCIEFYEPVLLNHAGLHRPRDILHVHGGSPFFLFQRSRKASAQSTDDCNRANRHWRVVRARHTRVNVSGSDNRSDYLQLIPNQLKGINRVV